MTSSSTSGGQGTEITFKGGTVRHAHPDLLGVVERLKSFARDSLQIQAQDILMGDPSLLKPFLLPFKPKMGAADMPCSSWEKPLDQCPHNISVGISGPH